jgi:alpha-tubulin suppressor-like RCC1 family protein
MLIAVCAITSQLHGQVSFTLSSTVIANGKPISVAAADINGDGKLDLISANNANNTLSVFTNNGNGGFGIASTNAVGSGPWSVIAANVNLDGKLDLISANSGNSTLSVLTNNGSGGFVIANNYTVGSSPTCVVAADVNGDGKLDLICANFGATTLSVLTNNGTGGFVAAGTFGVGVNPISVTVADVNGDGKMDLISADYHGNTLTVLTNDGTGGFVISGTYPVGSTPRCVVAADVNHDGKVDLISANNGNSTLSVLTNNGSGGFVISGTYIVGNGPQFVTAADVSGDGRMDLITANVNSTLSVLTNNGTGGFVLAASPGVGANPNSVVAADVNGDGNMDLISANYDGNTLSVLLNFTPFPIPVSQTGGTVIGWGTYEAGLVPPPAGLSNVVAIAAGSYFDLALISGGTVVGWGANGSGQINIPAGLSNVVAIAAGEIHSLALTASGTVIGWGDNSAGQTNIPSGLSNVIAISAFGEQSLALTASGSVVSWGNNSAGQRNIPAGLTNVTAISAGDYFDLALTAAGKVVAWGSNAYGQTNVPAGLSNVVAIAAGSSLGNAQSWGVALTSGGQVVGWGGNNFGQISIPSGLSNVVAIATGWYHSMALKADGTVIAWGRSDYGQINVPAGLSNVVAIAGGNVNSLALVESRPSGFITITNQPVSQTVTVGSTATFNVVAGGSSPLSFQWSLNTTNLAGATNATLTLTNVQSAQAGNYSVRVSNAYGSILSSNAALAVVGNPVPTGIPIITSFNPMSSAPGNYVNIWGTNFSSSASANTVYFGAVRATVAAASPTNLLVVVPTGATYAPITETVYGWTAYSPTPFIPTFPSGGPVSSSALAPRLDITAGNGPERIVFGDLDGDGKPDMVVANAYDGSIWVYRNISTNGSLTIASFAPPIIFAIGGGVDVQDGLTIADLDGDGRLDIVTANRLLGIVSIFQNLSSPGILTTNSFAARLDIAIAGGPAAVVVSDLNGDGKSEIVTANYSGNNVSVLQNISTGGILNTNSFASPIYFMTGPSPYGIAIADMDGDGKPDIITINQSDITRKVSIFRNVTTAGNISKNSFAPAVNLSGADTGETLAVGDLDGDGKPDIIAGSYTGSSVSVYRNISSAGSITTNSFSAPVVFAAGGHVHTVALGDLDGDGKPDLALVTQSPDKFSVFKNFSSPGVLTTNSLGARIDFTSGNNPDGIGIGDLDGNGRPDIAFGNSFGGTVSVYRNIIPFASAPECVPPPAGLVSWWPGEGNANDIVSGNNGMLMNGTGFTNSEVGMAFNLNGVNNFVLVKAGPNLTTGLQNGFTFESWINPTTVASVVELFEYERALATYNGSDVGILFAIHNTLPDGTPGSCLYANLLDTNGVVHVIASPANLLTAGVWQHVALSYDKASGMAAIFINGVAVTQTNLGTFTPQTGFTNLLLGARTTFGSVANPPNAYAGSMDEASFYSRALLPSEIAAIYSADSAGKCAPETTTCTPPPAGLVSWWPAEGSANDIFGGNNGSPVGNLGYTNGEVGQAFVFDNSTSYIPFPASSSLDLGTSGSGFTIECWVKPNAFNVAVSGPIVEWDSSSSTGLQLWSGPTLFANLLDTSGNNRILQSTNGIFTTNSWQHVAVTFDKSSGNAVIYYNGTIAATNNFGSITPQSGYPAYHLNIGRRTAQTTGLGYTYGGLLDELSFYNRALSASEIQAIYNAGSMGKCAPTPPPPTAQAAKATAVETNGFVIAVSIADGGYGYTGVPLVRFIGGGGSGAQGFAVVSNGVVTGITVTDAGSGYISAPVVVIDPPFISQPVLDIAPMSFLSFSNLTVGGTYQLQRSQAWYWTNQPVSFTATSAIYTQMVAGVVGSADYRVALNPVPTQAFATPIAFYGFIVGATVTSGGSGYVTSPTVSIVGGGGTNATAMAQISNGVVTNILITDAGIGYTNSPTIRIAAPPAAAESPTVLPVMRVDSSQLAPYDNYQIQFTPDLTAAWTNWNGGLFSPTATTNSQYLFITNDVGFFRLLYVP